MESAVALPVDALAAAQQIVDLAEERGVRLRLLGGLAFKIVCPSAMSAKYRRENKDIDMMGRREDCGRVMKLMETLGYKPREVFNKLSLGRRLIYYDMVNKRRVDIFLDEFEMCHKFDFRESLVPDSYTLPLTELVMTKLQVMEKTEKEYLDLGAAFSDHPVTKGQGGIDGEKIARVCSGDWGVYATFTKSLRALREWAKALQPEERQAVTSRIDSLLEMIEARGKSLAWKLRARIGEKARWYETVDADGDSMLA